MKAVAVNGSPRKKGNTEILLGKVLEPLSSAGWDTELIQLGGKKIRGCIACYRCFSTKDARCSVRTDVFNECFEKMLAAQAIILGTPTYFTDVSAERIEALLARIEQSGGPPPGVPATGLKMLFDETRRTAVVLQSFDTAEDMEAGAQVFSAMDSSETPGTRASVDMCELKLELPRSSAPEGELPELL